MKLAISAALVVTVTAAVFLVIGRRWLGLGGARLSGTLAGLETQPAVLAFANMSADPDNEYFSDGVAEEILNALAKVDELKVATIMIDEGPVLKRFGARAKGRGTRILKRTSHITVVVGSGKKA
jgi:hypothetical protein